MAMVERPQNHRFQWSVIKKVVNGDGQRGAKPSKTIDANGSRRKKPSYHIAPIIICVQQSVNGAFQRTQT